MKNLTKSISIMMITVIILSNVLTTTAYAVSLNGDNLADPLVNTQQTSTTTDATPTPQKALESAVAKQETVAAAIAPTTTPSPTPKPTQAMSEKKIIPYSPKAVLSSKALPLADMTTNDLAPHQPLPMKVQKLKKKDFAGDEELALVLSNPDHEPFTAKVLDDEDREVNVVLETLETATTTEVHISPSNQFTPGKFTVVITDADGYETSQDFTWGVLAFNTDKATYAPGETALLSMAVLNEKGEMVCDAKVTLEITSPGESDKTNTSDTSYTTNGSRTEILSTENGLITANKECHSTDFTLKPDYEATYQASQSGSYAVKLHADTQNGSFTINDSFSVKSTIPFDIKRTSSTRLYPPLTYPMNIEVTASEDFTGTITETVPNDFVITPATSADSYDNMQTMYLNDQSPEGELQKKVLGASTSSLVMPFSGEYPITQGFGHELTDIPLKDFYSYYGLSGHDGIDFGLPMGTPLFAVDDGEVVLAGPGDYGITVVIQHAWGRSYYGHLTTTTVETGFKVTKGSQIGYSGNTGESTGPHLHFGIKPTNPDMNNGYSGKVDPMKYLPIGGALPLTIETTDVLGASTSASLAPAPQLTPELVATDSAVLSATDSGTFNLQEGAFKQELTGTVSPSTQKVKIIKWDVSLKKGEKTTLSYSYKAPMVSPQFYTVGPLKFFDTTEQVVFEEGRKWQIASDAVGDIWYNPYWRYRKQVTVDHTKVGGAGESIAFVQSDMQFVGSGGSVTVTLPSVGAGNLLVAAISCWASSATGACRTESWSIADDQGNTWQDLGTRYHLNSGEGQGAFYAYNVAGGTTAITLTGQNQVSLIVAEYSGIERTSDPLETVVSQDYNPPNGGAITTGTLTLSRTTAEPHALYAFALENMTSVNNCQFNFNNSFTRREQQISGNGVETVAYADRIVTGAGTYSVTMTNTGCTSDENAGSLAVFKAASGAGGDPANFPMLVNLSSDAQLAAKAQSNGNDILFTDANGTKLSHEIESYNSATGALVAWVKIPNLSSSTDTKIYMYYGQPGAASQQDVVNVWDSNFKGVWHLDENPAVTCSGANEFCDATSNNNSGNALGGMTAGDSVAAKIGNGADFDGVNDAIQVADAASLDVSTMSISAWAFKRGQTGSTPFLARQQGTGFSDSFQAIYFNDSNGAYTFQVDDNGGQLVGSSSTGDVNSWVFLSFTWDGTTMKIYKNGSLMTSTTYVGTQNAETSPLCMAAGANDATRTCNSDWLNGILDEIRFSGTARSSTWIGTEYNNQSSPSTFYTLGSEETRIFETSNDKLMRHGKYFNSQGVKQPFLF